jgi:hypothetical protein
MSAILYALLAGGGLMGALWAWITWRRRKAQKAVRQELERRREVLAEDLGRLDDEAAGLRAQDEGHGQDAQEAEKRAIVAREEARDKLTEIKEIDGELRGLAAKYPIKPRKPAAGALFLAALLAAPGALQAQPQDQPAGEVCESLEETSLEGLTQALRELGPGIGADGARGLRLQERKILKLCGALLDRGAQVRALEDKVRALELQLVARAALIQVGQERGDRFKEELEAQRELYEQLDAGGGIKWGLQATAGPRLGEDEDGKRGELDVVVGIGVTIPFN